MNNKKTPLFLPAMAALLGSAATAAAQTQAELRQLEALKETADAVDSVSAPEAARAAWQAALTYGEGLYPADHPALSPIKLELAVTDYFGGDVKAATARTEGLLAPLEQAGDEWATDATDAKNFLVVLYLQNGRDADARGMAQDVLTYRRKVTPTTGASDKQIRSIGAAIDNLAYTENLLGNYTSAVALARESIEWAEKLSVKDPIIAPTYNNLPVYLERAGLYKEAIIAARQAYAAYEEFLPENHPYRVDVLLALARMSAEQGHLLSAELSARRAVAVSEVGYGEDHYQTQITRSLLSRILSAQGAHTEALLLSRRAYPILAEELGPTAQRALGARYAEAAALLGLGEADAALKLSTALYTHYTENTPVGDKDRMDTAQLHAELLYTNGRIEEAFDVFTELQNARRDVFPADNIDRLAGEVRLAHVAARLGQGESARAVAAADSLVRVVEQRQTAGGLGTEDLSSVQRAYGWALEAAIDSGEPDTVLAAASRLIGNGQVSPATAQSGSEAYLARADQERERLRLSRSYMRAIGSGAAPEVIAKLDEELAALEEVARSAPLRKSSAPTVRSLRRMLTNDSGMLITVAGPERVALTAITRHGAEVATAAIGAQEVATLTEQFRTALGASGTTRGIVPSRAPSSEVPYDFAPGAALYGALFPDAIKETFAEVSSLYVASGGSLSQIPFAALAPTPISGRLADADWLLRRHDVTTLAAIPTERGRKVSRKGAKTPRLVAIGAPDFTGERDDDATFRGVASLTLSDLPPLPESRREIDAFSALTTVDAQTILTGSAATEMGVRTALATPTDIALFATHGLLDAELSGLSEPALAFTPAEGSDGLLTASEIARERLAARWVILSACNTGGPAYAGASGLSGLADAFFYAGAENLLVSHWEVADAVAGQLTVPTVAAHLDDGTRPARALQTAMLALADGDGGERLQHPGFWAPFTYVAKAPQR